jgi:hypothetical protein
MYTMILMTALVGDATLPESWLWRGHCGWGGGQELPPDWLGTWSAPGAELLPPGRGGIVHQIAWPKPWEKHAVSFPASAARVREEEGLPGGSESSGAGTPGKTGITDLPPGKPLQSR